MNRVIMNIGIMKYILNLKDIFHEPYNYEYWSYKKYFKFEI